MSDFDDVLERLLMEPQFRAALATDPATALAGYRLSAEELRLLQSQLTGDQGATGTVEERTSKASLAGLFGPLLDLAGGGRSTAIHHLSARQNLSDVQARQGLSEVRGSSQGLSDVGAADQGLADVGGADQGLSDVGGANQGLSDVGGANQGLTDVPGAGTGQHAGSELHRASAAPVPAGYHPHIDADGDGHWDTYTTRRGADGGIEILVDRNHDGTVDFVGHDRDGDGLVESADYDKDFNGTYETHMRDINGDGWLDTRTVDPKA